ncbi:unnamed protein product [Lymnaea stagnalis]|uniref:Receptor for retinol uptake STRA6 n=1 Tax=Lymnaea stagnalis TaxID=6523 RepID=A0AAV2HSK8_LYMST
MSLEDFNIYFINNWILIPVACIIWFLSFLEKRKRRQDVCDGRPALIIPIPFLDGYENRMAYSVAFGTITNTFVSLVLSEDTLGFDMPLWGRALYVYLQAFIGCLTCFPLVACLSTRYRAIGAIICILYSMTWFSLNVVETIKEVRESENDTLWGMAPFDDVTFSLSKANAILQGLPSIFCYLVLMGYCVYVLYRCVVNRTFYNRHTEGSVRRHQEDHVRWVLRKSKDKTYIDDAVGPKKSFVERMAKDRKLRLVKSLPFFKYPTKIFAIAFVQVNIIYWMGMFLISGTISIVYGVLKLNFDIENLSTIEKENLALVSICAGVALIVAISGSIVHIFMAIRNYRYHMLRIYQGDKEFAVQFEDSSQYILTSSMLYPGYQVGFMLWGCVLSFVFVLLTSLCIAEPIYWLTELGLLGDLAVQLAQTLSFPATMLLLFYLQMFMCKRVLLQKRINQSDEHPPLNVDNRKLYEIINYLSMFTNMAVGVFTCLLRIIVSAFFGVFSVGRLDKSVFTRDMETFDRGYKAYLSMLLVDNAHNNPSMRVFAHLLWTKVLASRFKQGSSSGSFSDTTPLTPPIKIRQRTFGTNSSETPSSAESGNPWTFCDGPVHIQVSNQSLTRWFLAFTLIHNPQLTKLRKHALKKDVSSSPTPDDPGSDKSDARLNEHTSLEETHEKQNELGKQDIFDGETISRIV